MGQLPYCMPHAVAATLLQQKRKLKSIMKTLKTISKMILFAAVVTLVSCNKDDDNNAWVPSGSGDYYMKGKVDGNDYNNSAYFAPTSTLNSGTLMIQSSTDGGNSMQIQIPNFDGEGTYNSGGNVLANGYINYMTLTPFKTYTSVRGSGTVEVTEVTETYIKGTFSAVAPENEEGATTSVTITEGDFKVKR